MSGADENQIFTNDQNINNDNYNIIRNNNNLNEISNRNKNEIQNIEKNIELFKEIESLLISLKKK